VVDLSHTPFLAAEEALVALGLKGLPLLKIGNKVDLATQNILESFKTKDYVLISAQKEGDVDPLKEKLLELVQHEKMSTLGTIVVNARHYDRLQKSKQALEEVLGGLAQNLSNELLVLDIHRALHALGEITGEITTEEILGEIFSKFCVGK
jgi:tRNA modification GTPase